MPAQALSAPETEVLRSGLGDSFNAVEAFPGTVPVFSGVPYMLVRGAPPSGTIQFYDGVPVPALFHVALGPSITHPSLLGSLDFHPGVAPARYGRFTGAVLVANGPRAQQDHNSAELEARVLDAHALLRMVDPGLSVHTRIAYADPLLDAIGSSAVLSYWDYLARFDQTLANGDRVSLWALGAGDRVGDRAEPSDDIDLQFHRALARWTRKLNRLELGGQLYGGYEHGVLGAKLTAAQTRIGPSTWVEITRPYGTRLRFGLDMEAKLATLDHHPDVADDGTQPFGSDPDDRYLPPEARNDVPLAGPEDVVQRTFLAERSARNAVGMYGELALTPVDPISVELGVRHDLWLVSGRDEQALDPRVVVRAQVLPELTWHVGAGVAHQGVVSPVPIPGLSDFELDYGLQRTLQGETGLEVQLPEHFSASATGFYHRLADAVFLELIIDCEGNTDPLAPLLIDPFDRLYVPLCKGKGLPRANGNAYGVELMVKRDLLARFGGWISYTLAWAEATAEDGTDFVPQYDVRHVINAVLTQDWGGGWSTGLRVHYRSGKPAVNTLYDFTDFTVDRMVSRLPPFFRADVNLTYAWDTSWGRLALLAQFMNVTFSREATKQDCIFDQTLNLVCTIAYQPAIVLPNVGLRAEL